MEFFMYLLGIAAVVFAVMFVLGILADHFRG